MDANLTTDAPDSSATLRSVRRLGMISLVLNLILLVFSVSLQMTLRAPKEFFPHPDQETAFRDAKEMKADLDSLPTLSLFDEPWYFEMIYKAIENPDSRDSQSSIEQKSQYLINGYRGRFEDTARIVHALVTIGGVGAALSLLLLQVPKIGVSGALLLAMLFITPPFFYAVVRINLSHLWPYCVPFVLIPPAILVLLIRDKALKDFAAKPSLREIWVEIALSLFGVIFGLGAAIWIIADGGHVRYKTAGGAGLMFVFGVMGLYRGIRRLMGERKRGKG
jgi:hypothetical protein